MSNSNDFHQAIQAATESMPVDLDGVAADLRSIAAKGAWGIPELVAERIIAVTPDLVTELQTTRDQVYNLEAHAAELRDLLELLHKLMSSERLSTGERLHDANTVKARVRAALQADGPARGHAILHEIQRLRRSEAQARSVIALHQQNGCGTQLYAEGLRVEIQRLRKVLDELVWVADFGNEQAEYCHICHGSRPDHRDGCFIGKALDQTAQREDDRPGERPFMPNESDIEGEEES